MKLLAILALASIGAASQPTDDPPKGSAEQRAIYEHNHAIQAEFEQQMFVEAGFKALHIVAAQKRVVMRALFQDSYRGFLSQVWKSKSCRLER